MSWLGEKELRSSGVNANSCKRDFTLNAGPMGGSLLINFLRILTHAVDGVPIGMIITAGKQPGPGF